METDTTKGARYRVFETLDIRYASGREAISMTSRSSTSSGNASLPSFGHAMFPHANIPFKTPPTREVRRREVVGWQEWDYLDYADFEKAMKEDQSISYALCQWLVRQPHGNPGDPFTDSEWEEWYEYAVEHCSRFAREQPRTRW